MAELQRPRTAGTPVLQIGGLNVFYGHSHALQGVDLVLPHGVLSVVGRNGMGKSTLCKAIMGLVPVAGGSVRVLGEEMTNRAPAQIARAGVGYVPQGRRLWPSLTVEEHLRMTAMGHRGGWSVERIYDTFPRLAERKTNRGGQLSGGEQQMLAISRALLLNPHLLIMDEPTEGLAPVIVDQVEEMLLRLAEEGEIAVLVIEQNIGVATAVSQRVAIMVNGRINRTMEASRLASDRELQQRLLGVGRHGHEDVAADVSAEEEPSDAAAADRGRERRANGRGGPTRIYMSNPTPPTRWSQPVSVARIEAAARTASGADANGAADDRRREAEQVELRPLAAPGQSVVLVAGTLDTKGDELRFIRDLLKESGVQTRLVDLSTSGKPSSADVPPHLVAAYHRGGPNGVFTSDRGASVAAMADAFEAWITRQSGIAGIVSAGGSGGTAMVAPAMRALPIGVPKVMISTVASGDVGRYVGPSDIMMMHSVTDVQGLNSISRQVLANGAQALAGMVKARQARSAAPGAGTGRAAGDPRSGGDPRSCGDLRSGGDPRSGGDLPAIGLTMFGVTTTAVQQVTAALRADWDCLVFHATGTGGRSMEKLIEQGLLTGVIDLTTTEICDMMMGGVFAADEDRFGAVIRRRMAYVGACGALDMVNFGVPDTVPERYRGRLFYRHNPQVTLMRTTVEENARMGEWIGERLNRMEAPVRFFLPEGGVSALDAPGQAFHDPAATGALFTALERTVRQTGSRQVVRVPHHINEPAFAAAIVEAFRSLHGGRAPRRRAGG